MTIFFSRSLLLNRKSSCSRDLSPSESSMQDQTIDPLYSSTIPPNKTKNSDLSNSSRVHRVNAQFFFLNNNEFLNVIGNYCSCIEILAIFSPPGHDFSDEQRRGLLLLLRAIHERLGSLPTATRIRIAIFRLQRFHPGFEDKQSMISCISVWFTTCVILKHLKLLRLHKLKSKRCFFAVFMLFPATWWRRWQRQRRKYVSAFRIMFRKVSRYRQIGWLALRLYPRICVVFKTTQDVVISESPNIFLAYTDLLSPTRNSFWHLLSWNYVAYNILKFDFNVLAGSLLLVVLAPDTLIEARMFW